MKITLFTSNQPRHLGLIKLLSRISTELYVVQEVKTLFPGTIEDHFKKSEAMANYFLNVTTSEKKIFGENFFLQQDSTSIITMKNGDLGFCSQEILAPALNSDFYVVFGSSYIKGELAQFLVKNRAINIHMGVSPYYRGSSCNFWAVCDQNPHMVGATIHYLSKGLDNGDIIATVLPDFSECSSAFDFTMKSVMSAQKHLVSIISDKSLHQIKTTKQNKELQIRYSKRSDFTDETLEQYNLQNNSIENLKVLFNKKFKSSDYHNLVIV